VYADKSDLLELAGANGMSVWCESRNIWGNPGDPPLSKRLTPLYAAPQAAQSVWLPIESAPQDKAVDLWCKSTSNPAYGRRVTSVCLVGDDWYGANLPNPSFGEYASHWMALPSPPDSLVKN
jgi:hypothetical protein